MKDSHIPGTKGNFTAVTKGAPQARAESAVSEFSSLDPAIYLVPERLAGIWVM
jgi:hypothetical protein